MTDLGARIKLKVKVLQEKTDALSEEKCRFKPPKRAILLNKDVRNGKWKFNDEMGEKQKLQVRNITIFHVWHKRKQLWHKRKVELIPNRITLRSKKLKIAK